MRGQIEMVRSYDEKRGRKPNEKNLTAEVNGRRSRGRQEKRWGAEASVSWGK